MPENERLSGSIDQIDLAFVEREATPRFLMKLSTILYRTTVTGLPVLLSYNSRT